MADEARIDGVDGGMHARSVLEVSLSQDGPRIRLAFAISGCRDGNEALVSMSQTVLDLPRVEVRGGWDSDISPARSPSHVSSRRLDEDVAQRDRS